jgi:uracil-DNA glycosylase
MTAQEFFGGWYKCLNPIELNNVIAKVRPLYEQHKVYPYFKEIFNAFKYCDYNELKVVIVGMDPYNDGAATGLAFANRESTHVISPSLGVIKDCLEQNYTSKRAHFDVTLESWARQGVLLLNSSLTVEDHKPGSHSMLWRKFIASFLQGLGKWQTGIIYVLMGEQAKTFKPYIGPFNDVIECKHPAYYARVHQPMPNIFKQIDELTWGKNKLKITWI